MKQLRLPASRKRAAPSNNSSIPFVHGATLWLTGLPCSGKTTLALRLGDELRERGQRVEVLDGDVMRESLCSGLGFSKADRDESVRRIACVCRERNEQGVTAIAAVVSPYREIREKVRASLPKFSEIYVRAPLELCIARDVKGQYAKALRGEIEHFTGIDDPYEEPRAPEIVADTSIMNVEQSVRYILLWVDLLSEPIFAMRRPLTGTRHELAIVPALTTSR